MNKKINGRIGNLGNKETMARNLKKYLDSRGLNPHQFADIMNFKYTTVMNWMSANSYPRIDKIELMAQYFGINKSDLVEEDDSTVKTTSSKKPFIEETIKNLKQLTETQQELLLKLSNLDLDDIIVNTAEMMSKSDERLKKQIYRYVELEYSEYEREQEEKNTDKRNSAG